MKLLFLCLFVTVCTSVFSQTISIFESEADVLFYLSSRGNFTNHINGVTLTFSDMGSRMRSNKGVDYFSPDVNILSRTRATVTYQSLTSGGIAKIIVDGKENVIADKSDMTVYSPRSFEDEHVRKNERNNKSVNATTYKNSKTNYYKINGETRIPSMFVGKYVQDNNYVIITKISEKKGSVTVSYNGRKYTVPFNPNYYMNSNHIQFYQNKVVTYWIFGVSNKENRINEIDLSFEYEDNWSIDAIETREKIRFKRQ